MHYFMTYIVSLNKYFEKNYAINKTYFNLHCFINNASPSPICPFPFNGGHDTDVSQHIGDLHCVINNVIFYDIHCDITNNNNIYSIYIAQNIK